MAEADRRVALSRRVLSEWMQNGTEETPEKALAVIHAELVALEHIADVHPGKMQHMLSLVMDWIRVQERLKCKLH